METLASRWAKIVHLFQVRIWQPQYLKDRSIRGILYAIFRVVSITVHGVIETNAASRAAALSFSSLLGLGPLISIAVLVAGFTIDKSDPNFAANTVNRLIEYLAPPLTQYEKVLKDEREAAAASSPGEASKPAGLLANPELVQIINQMIEASRSGTIGVLGIFILIIIVLQLFTSVETTFNEIWGVRRGRSWLLRIVFYWTILTLGALLFFGAAAGFSASAFLDFFAEKMKFPPWLIELLEFLLPPLSTALLVGMLTLFYRAIPNTRVLWRAAFFGALVVASLIVLNNMLSFLYVKRVLMNRSLYGSLTLPLVIMLGLYVFWLFILLGGVVSYAIQNVHFRNSQAAWNSLSESLRERLTLLVLLTVGRRFDACLAACTASQLSETLKVPTQILNECLNRLIKMELVSAIPAEAGGDASDFRYQPGRPLRRITLREFKRRDDDLGDASSALSVSQLDPVLQAYDKATNDALGLPLFESSLEELFRQFPFETVLPAQPPSMNAPVVRAANT